jgi:CheY-like chemotaxis protein
MTEGVLAVVKDLFFVTRIRETGRLSGTPVEVCRSVDDLTARLTSGPLPDLVIVDLTTPGWDYAALFALLDGQAPRPRVLGFTTHALARTTQPWHSRCDRVVTKETLTQELPDLLTRAR